MDFPMLPRRARNICLHLCLWPAAVLGAEAPVDKVAKVATEWVNVRAATVKAEAEWKELRGLMEATVKALNERAGAAEEAVEQLKADSAQMREEAEALERRNASAAASLAAAEGRLDELVRALVEMRPSLPPRLSDALELPYRSLATADLPAGERMRHLMTVLNRCVMFNRMISTGEEVLTPPGEAAPKSLEVIYWGLSHGYALDRPAGRVWLGAPGSQGWAWQASSLDAGELAQLIALANDQGEPAFIIAPTIIAAKPAASQP
jgi:hypothetical protein